MRLVYVRGLSLLNRKLAIKDIYLCHKITYDAFVRSYSEDKLLAEHMLVPTGRRSSARLVLSARRGWWDAWRGLAAICPAAQRCVSLARPTKPSAPSEPAHLTRT